MKKILVALAIEEKEKEAVRRCAEASGEECEIVFTTPAEATEEQVREANFILGNVPPKKIAGSENLAFLRRRPCCATRPALMARPCPSTPLP